MSLTTSLSAGYRFNNGAIITDVLATYTFTNVNTVTSTASGKNGYGANFGNPNSTKLLYNDSLTSASGYPKTIIGWFYANVVTGDGNVFSLANSGGSDYIQLKLRNADSHIVVRSNTGGEATDVDTGVVALVNTWYFYAVVINSSTSVTIQINGTETNTASTIDSTSGLDRFALGALGRATPIQFFSGIQDEVYVWGRALSSYERNLMYDSGLCGMTYPFTDFAETSTETEGYSYALQRVVPIDETSTSVETYNIASPSNTAKWTNQSKSSATWTNLDKS